MSSLDKIMEENMVCATVNASHNATSSTIRAYLAAHQPERTLAFNISTPSTEAQDWCARTLRDAGISLSSRSNDRHVGTATGRLWTKLLIEEGDHMDAHSILLSPVRPGSAN